MQSLLRNGRRAQKRFKKTESRGNISGKQRFDASQELQDWLSSAFLLKKIRWLYLRRNLGRRFAYANGDKVTDESDE